jgi:ABC-type lipoprotein release transport system permease subunit
MIGALRNMPEVVSLTPRLLAGGFLEANYKTRLDGEEPEELAVQVAGIDPIIEDSVTHFSDLVIDGEYLTSDDRDAILVGRDILEYYAAGLPGESTLSNVHVGDTVRLQIGSIVREVTIKGVLKSKVNVVGQRVYMVDSHVRQILGRSDTNVNEIAVVLNDTYVPIDFKNSLRGYDFYYDAHVQTWDESQGKFFEDIVSTFSILGAIVGAIGALVASITIFIVIFINAISRQRYIGILKGIGVCGNAITVSYVLQSFFYSLIGNAIGIALLYAVLEPYLRANPIDFPFSDGILYVPVLDVLIRVLILFAVTLMAGYIPARMVVKRNTLDTILGR